MEQNLIENELVILSKATIDKLLKYDNVADLLSVYIFYYYTAKWQKTNQPKATNEYVVKGLKISRSRVVKAKELLESIGLIQPTQTRDKDGKVTGWYIKLNYIWSDQTIQTTLLPQVVPATSGKRETNASSANNINALNTNIITTGQLPDSRGKNYIFRVLSIYRDLFRNKYGFAPTISVPRFGKSIKELVSTYSELQIAALLVVFFNWKGITGDNDFESTKLINAAYPIQWFHTSINQYEVYLRNVFHLDFENEEAVREFVGKAMVALL